MTDNSGVSGQTSSFLGNLGRPGTPNSTSAGDIVFSAEAYQILKKWEVDRVERNSKREDRRKAGATDVSDDEPDDLTPFLIVVPSGERDGLNAPPELPVVPESVPPVSADTSEGLLFDDSVAERNSFHVHDNSIPSAIRSLAKNGISPALTLFLPASLERIRSSNVKTVKHGTGEATKVTVIDLTDFPNEQELDQATWCTCYNTFLTFMEGTAGVRTFQSFAAHYNRMLSDPDLAVWFPAYRDFDRRIRAQFFTKPYIIVHDDEYRSALQTAKNTFLMLGRLSLSTGSATHPRGGSSSVRDTRGSSSLHDDSSRDRPERPKPYERESHRKILCFRCGRSGHPAGNCPESTPSRHGREFVIYANRDGLFRLTDNRAVCMGFNIRKCDATGREHAIHICALCGDSCHGAVDCTRN
ncbi:hypothetical protein DFH08DRAFT_708788 [Mycena albidolilacea]|uniref:CCHC-type domain-containing protein n=1 Tax=Mycena albidolilacea TaxID=1033008 RepID=A0AAD6ZNK9_9AGAR|nr:hypothetical protein DFH08DRAFT_708788 [Mycena albidolilacea]